MSAGESVSDLLVQIKEKVVAAMDPSISASSRQALNSDYKSLLRQISQVVQSAEFNGSNILDGSLLTDIKFLANEAATNFITLSVKNMTLGNSIITVGMASSIGTVTIATTVLARIDASLANVNSALGDIGAQAKQIENHNTFVSKLTDVLTSGVGNLVDADVAKESAALQALQVQQQLGAQALSIANSAPQIILSLFRGG